MKCNVHASWVNKVALSGGAWFVQNIQGQSIYHNRDAFTPSDCHVLAELWCIVWAMETLHDVHIRKVEVASDCMAAVEAISNPKEWPRYRNVLDKIKHLMSEFE